MCFHCELTKNKDGIDAIYEGWRLTLVRLVHRVLTHFEQRDAFH